MSPRRRWVAVLALGPLLVAACSDDGDESTPTTTTRPTSTSSSSTTTTAPERPISTTTTAFDPASVEGQVEAAYLKSWDVYADAVYNLKLDEPALSEVYGEPYLTTLRSEIERRISEGDAALVAVEHNYTIQLDGPDLAYLVDEYRNHQRLIDPVSKEPVEVDPDETLVDLVTLRRVDGTWRVHQLEAAG